MSNQFQRDSFFNKLYELASKDRNLFIVVADMSAPALDRFRTNLPNQFINVGIAEQNAIQIASGLAMTGKKVFAYAISPFITLRALEQIRVSNGIMGIPITIVGMGTGLSYEKDGPTHHLIEDISIMRALPNIKIMNITDSNLAAKAAESSYHSNLTTYVRLDKDLYPCIHDESSPLGNGMKTVMEGQNIVLFSTGPITHLGIDVAKKIAHKLKFQIKVVDVFEIPINGKKLLEHASSAKLIFTLEEHFLPGGFGSAVCEVLADNGISIPVKRIGIDIQNGYKFCYTYGGRNAIRKCLGIDFDSIYSALTVKIAQFS